MTSSPSPEIDTLVRHLRESGLDIHDPGTGEFLAAPRGAGGPRAVVAISERDLRDYVADLTTSYGLGADDPLSGARGLVAVHLLDHLTTDHGGGVNRVRRLAMVRGEDGVQLVEERTDDPGPPPADGPHDDPATFVVELDSLAAFLREQGLDAVADPGRAAIGVGPAGRGAGARDVVVDLRPDLYRRHLEAQEQEYEAVGGEPRGHAWTAWCRLVASLLARSPRMRRLSFVVTPDGEVGLAADADGDEPPEPRYVWQADPGT